MLAYQIREFGRLTRTYEAALRPSWPSVSPKMRADAEVDRKKHNHIKHLANQWLIRRLSVATLSYSVDEVWRVAGHMDQKTR
ncbi:hypothetical protein CHU98_g8514 [Xylaria longipes]|nr:hypothetical protein CHU98_g8514 [Xylaria longipes]